LEVALTNSWAASKLAVADLSVEVPSEVGHLMHSWQLLEARLGVEEV
jgi:hypothetical protein